MGLAAEEMLGRVILKGNVQNTLSCIHLFVNWVDKRKMLRKNAITALTQSNRNIRVTNITRKRLRSSMLMTRIRKI